MKTISKLNRIIGAIKRLIQGNARVTLIVNGGRIERYEVSKIVQVDDPA